MTVRFGCISQLRRRSVDKEFNVRTVTAKVDEMRGGHPFARKTHCNSVADIELHKPETVSPIAETLNLIDNGTTVGRFIKPEETENA